MSLVTREIFFFFPRNAKHRAPKEGNRNLFVREGNANVSIRSDRANEAKGFIARV